MTRRHALRTLLPMLLLTACGEQSLHTGHLPATKFLRVGMDMTYPPFEYKNPAGEPEGVDVDIAKALASELGLTLQLEALPFDGLMPALQTDQIDLVISGMTANDERRRSIDFSDPYATTGIALLVGASTSIRGPADLRDPSLRFVAKIGTTGETYIRQHHPQNPLTVLDDEINCVAEVANGTADAFIYDQLSIYTHQKKHPSKTRALLQPLRSEAWAMGLKKGNTALLTKVNAFLATFRASGRLAALGDKYLAEEKKVLQSMGIPFILQ